MAASPPESPSPAAAPPRPRRRLRPWRAALLLALLVLIGRGLGLTGGDPAPAPGGRSGAEAPGAAGVAAAPAAAPATAVIAPAGPLAETAQPAPAAAPPEVTAPPAVPAAGMDADRFATRLGAVAWHLERRDLGGALQVLQQLRAAPLDGAQQAALLPQGEALQQALAAACAEIVEHLCQGRAVAAQQALAAWFGASDVPLAPWLDEALRAAGLPAGLCGELVVPAAAPLPLPKALPRGAQVRLYTGARQGTGTVVASRSGEVTVRLATPQGFAFPTVPAVACEVVDPGADDAIEAGLRAAHAGSAALARAWLAVARLRSPAGLGERGLVLARLLP